MNLRKRILYAVNTSSIALLASIWTPIIPCKTLSKIPTRPLDWSICTLNPDAYLAVPGVTKFFGYTTSISDAFLILVVGVFVVVFLTLKFINFEKR